VPKKRKPSPPLVPLTGKQKSYLRALAHKLKPVVQIGHQGVTDGLLAALDTALERHELLKVKVAGEAEVDAAEIAPKLQKASKSQLVQIIGHTLVLYRKRAENPKIVFPKSKPAKARPAAAASPAPAAEDEDLDGEDFEDDEDEDDEDEDDENEDLE
jgi:RNA-binding protein